MRPGPIARRWGLPDLSILNPVLKAGPAATTLAVVAFSSIAAGMIATIRTGKWLPRVVLVTGAVVWPLPDHPLQGPVVAKLSYLHGIHLADLLSILALVVAVIPWRRIRAAMTRG